MRRARGYNAQTMATAAMQIADLRQIHSRALEGLFQEEIQRWRDDLYWDYRPSVELIRKFVDSRALAGYVAMESGQPAGYGFYILDDHKGLIGGLFVSSKYEQASITQKLIAEMLGALRATPHLQRIEAQLMPFGSDLDPVFLSQHFQLFTRQFMVLPIAQANVTGKPLSEGLRIEPWSDRSFEAAARLIQLAYANHVDAEINDQYRSTPGAMKFLRNIVLLPGCGQFLPEASFVVRPLTTNQPIAMVLTSRVAEGVGHTTQLCVMPGHQGHSVGRKLMEHSISALRSRRYQSLSLTVTSINKRAAELYEHLGFRTVKSFAAGVWNA